MREPIGRRGQKAAVGRVPALHLDQRVFAGDRDAGEISDGVHNFGFSQFLTIFHPSLEFREYADKMASLCGVQSLSSDSAIWSAFKQLEQMVSE